MSEAVRVHASMKWKTGQNSVIDCETALQTKFKEKQEMRSIIRPPVMNDIVRSHVKSARLLLNHLKMVMYQKVRRGWKDQKKLEHATRY